MIIDKLRRNEPQSPLDYTIEVLLFKLNEKEPTSDEYAKIVTQIERLQAVKDHNRPRRVSPDTLALVIGNLAGIILIVEHERANVVTSKALQFILKAGR